MTQQAELVIALLGGAGVTTADAEAVIAAARDLNVDVLDYCCHRYGSSADEILARGADWAGLAFSAWVPTTRGTSREVRRLDSFAGVRSLREPLFDREVLYLAPTFPQLVRLRAHVAAHPEVRGTTCITPAAAIRTALAGLSADQLLDESRQRLLWRWPQASAHLDLGWGARLVFAMLVLGFAALALLAPILLEHLLLPLLTMILVVPGLFKLWAALALFRRLPTPALPLTDAQLPVYSVLIPLRDEAQMVPQLHRALTSLNYPPEKLDIKFVVEAASITTVAAVRELLDDPRFELIEVPAAEPATKPKALNYALPFARGHIAVVYDAEDIPDPDQLRLAASAFAADPGVDCLQAALLIDNARENLLTGLFAGEYAGQFEVIMPALVAWSLPVPLGGTSNHFRVRSLREMGGWDAFNVTEDADLGVRLARLRYRTAMLPSQTWEEAPVELDAWMRQRTRWMKGWMQTFIVHNRNPLRLLNDIGWRGFLGFEIHVGAMILSPLLHTAFIIGLLLSGFGLGFGIGGVWLEPDDPLRLYWLAILVIGYGGSLATVVAGLLRLGQKRLLAHQLLLPAYWTLHAMATLRAAVELVTRPHFWAKTPHGLTQLERSSVFGRAPAPLPTRREPQFESWGR